VCSTCRRGDRAACVDHLVVGIRESPVQFVDRRGESRCFTPVHRICVSTWNTANWPPFIPANTARSDHLAGAVLARSGRPLLRFIGFRCRVDLGPGNKNPHATCRAHHDLTRRVHGVVTSRSRSCSLASCATTTELSAPIALASTHVLVWLRPVIKLCGDCRLVRDEAGHALGQPRIFLFDERDGCCRRYSGRFLQTLQDAVHHVRI